MYIFNLFDFFLFSVLEKRERKYGIGTKLDFFFTFVAKSSFRLIDIMATTDFLLKQSTTNNRHAHTHKNPSQSPLEGCWLQASFWV
jgi:hypothetical protein